MTTERTYRISCGKCGTNEPIVGDHMARVHHDECRQDGWFVMALPQAEGCYCSTLQGTFCDFCTGLRSLPN